MRLHLNGHLVSDDPAWLETLSGTVEAPDRAADAEADAVERATTTSQRGSRPLARAGLLAVAVGFVWLALAWLRPRGRRGRARRAGP